jgi:transcriptional regulator with XRE-family HTH domain
VKSCCAECGQEILYLGEGPPPERCEDCVPETGSGSPLAGQLARNLHRLRGDADLTGEELAQRAGFTGRQDVFGYEGNAAPEPGVIRALRFAHSLGASIDQLTDRIYWNPGETAPRPRERRPPSERLSGFFLVLAASEPVFDPVPPRAPVTDRHEAAAIFGQNLRGARERRHLTQESLAHAAGLSKAGLSLIERGIRETTIETLLALARSLEVTPESLLAGISWIPRCPPCAVPRRGGAQRRSAHGFDSAIKRQWGEGRTASAIAATLDTSPGDVSAVVHRLRERGEELPYRNPPMRGVHERARSRRAVCLQAPSGQRDGQAGDEGAGLAACLDGASELEVAARIGANMAHCREKVGLTLRELGEATELDRSYLHDVEKGKNASPRVSLIVKLAASLNVPPRRITSGVSWEPDSAAFRIETMAEEADTALERLGGNLLRARRRAGVSQQALGARASVDRGDVVDFERANRNFRIFTVVRLASALETDLAELFSGVTDWYVRPLPAPEYAPGDGPPSKSERDALLARLWKEGKPEREIAEALDLTVGAVGPYVRELRDAGENLPYRRPPRSAIEKAARRRRGGCCELLSVERVVDLPFDPGVQRTYRRREMALKDRKVMIELVV